jgi:hypothetical protein
MSYPGTRGILAGRSLAWIRLESASSPSSFWPPWDSSLGSVFPRSPGARRHAPDHGRRTRTPYAARAGRPGARQASTGSGAVIRRAARGRGGRSGTCLTSRPATGSVHSRTTARSTSHVCSPPGNSPRRRDRGKERHRLAGATPMSQSCQIVAAAAERTTGLRSAARAHLSQFTSDGHTFDRRGNADPRTTFGAGPSRGRQWCCTPQPATKRHCQTS